MARKINPASSEAYNLVFPRRLRDLMASTNTTQADLAAALGKTRQAIGYYQDGSSSPTWQSLCRIADYFDVSVDYLLGRTDVKSVDGDVLSVIKYTGLTESAVKALSAISQHRTYLVYSVGGTTELDLPFILSKVLSNRKFPDLISSCGMAINLLSTASSHEEDLTLALLDSWCGAFDDLNDRVMKETNGSCCIASIGHLAKQYQFMAGKQLEEIIETLSAEKEDE